jgi:hypothetical protein
MKKKVRIYKAPDGQGAFLNKTAKFLKKAQEGGTPDPSMMGYPGAQQEQAQPSEDQITQSIVVDISNGRPKEETVVKLVQLMGQDPMQVSQYYDQIYASLEAQQEELEEETDEDSENEPIKEEIEQNAASQEIEEGFYGDDTNNDLANEITAEDDEQDYADDDQVASDIIMQFGGVSPVMVPIRQEGGQAYPIQFPGVEAYLPFNMSEMLSGDVDPLTGQAWSPQAEEEAAVAPDDEEQTDFRNGGQYKKNKRSYVNSVMKLVKKQMGGEDMSKKGDTDPRGEDVRKQRLDSFLGTIKNQSQIAKAKEQAEQEYDQMMQQQQQMMQQPIEQPMAQYGMQIPMRRGLFGRPKIPRGFGFGYGMPPITKMDVRRTGIFGRPKQYTMEFGMPGAMPGMALPGYGAGFYGYGQTSKTKSKGRIITEEVAKTVNNVSNAEVASNTPDSTATNKPDDKNSSVSNADSTASNIKTNNANTEKRKAVNVNDESNDAVINNSNIKRKETEVVDKAKSAVDAWGRDKNSKWYGYDPKTKTWTKGKPDWATKAKKDDSFNFAGTDFAKAIDYNKIKNTGKDLYRSLPDADKVAKAVGWNKIKNTAGDLYNALPDAPSRQKFVDWGILADENDPTYKMAKEYRQTGGFIDSENPNLYKFVYGGNDPYFTQGDLDDVYSKDTSDPYFAMGGLTTYQNKGEVKEDDYDKYQREKAEKEALDEYNAYMNRGPEGISKKIAYAANPNDAIYNKILGQTRKKYNLADPNEKPKSENTTTTTKKKTTTTQDDEGGYPSNPGIGYNGFNMFGNLFPASIASYQGSWNKIKKGPYDPRSGAMMSGMGFGPNTQVNSIDVKRSGMFGRPKKYTINFSNQQMDPRKQNLITLPGQGAPGAQGYSGQEPAAQQQGDRFSNTKGLKAGTRAKVAMKELFNRYSDEEEVPTGDVASTSNEPSPTQTPLSDEEEAAKFQQQQRQRGKRWDEEKQAWVDNEQIKMELNKPGKIGATKDIQARLDQDARAKEAKESFADYGDISSELGDKNVQSEYQKIYESRGKEAAENFMDEQFTKRNQGIADREVAAKAEADQENQKSEQDYRNSMDQQYMEDLGVGDLYQAPTAKSNQLQSNQPSQSFEGYPFGEEPEADESFDKGYFGQNQFRNYDILQRQEAAARKKAQQQASNKQQNVPQSDIAVNKQKGKQVQNKSYTSSEEAKVKAMGYASMDEYLEEKRRAESMFDDNRTESEKKADEEAYAKARVTEREREKREANDPELQKQKRESEKIGKKESAAYKDIYEKPLQEVTGRRDRIIKDLKNNPRLSKEKRDRKITEIEQWYQRQEKQLSDKAHEQQAWYNEEVNKGKRANLSKKGSGYMSNVRQFGGDLRRFTGGMQQFPNGGSPVTFTDNPALVGMSNVDMISLNEGIPGLQQSSFWGDQASFNKPAPVNTQKQPEQIKMDKTQVSSDQAKKAYQATPGDFSMDVKVKDTWEINTPQAIASLNAGVTGVAGMIDRFNNKKRDAKMYENLTADNLYASDPSRDRGDYDTNTGLYRPNEQGAVHTSRSAQYGGMIYQDGGYYDEEDDDVAYMTEDQIRQFLANGGEIEYL